MPSARSRLWANMNRYRNRRTALMAGNVIGVCHGPRFVRSGSQPAARQVSPSELGAKSKSTINGAWSLRCRSVAASFGTEISSSSTETPQRLVTEDVVVLLKNLSLAKPGPDLLMARVPNAVVPAGLAHPREELLARPARALGALATSGVPIASKDESAALDERDEPGKDRVVVPWALDRTSELLRVAAAEDVAFGSAWVRGCMDAGCDRPRTVGQRCLGEGEIVRERPKGTVLRQVEPFDRQRGTEDQGPTHPSNGSRTTVPSLSTQSGGSRLLQERQVRAQPEEVAPCLLVRLDAATPPIR